MKHIKLFEAFFDTVAKPKFDIGNYIADNNIQRINKRGKIKEFLYYGTDIHPDHFTFDNEYERTTSAYDFELPDGVIFLTNDVKEAQAYGRYVIPIELLAKKIVIEKVYSDSPSRAFDDDYMGSGKMYRKFFDNAADCLEVKGNYKSTFITYPDMAFPRTDIAIAYYKIKEGK